MNLDNFLLTPEEATNLADDLIQQQVHISGVSISEPASVYAVSLAVVVALVAAIVAIYITIIAVINTTSIYVNVYGS
jgi:uncharacterized integral membrane protein